MTPLALLLAGGFALAAATAYILFRAAALRLRWFHLPLVLAGFFALFRAADAFFGSGYDSETARAAVLGLPVLLGALAALPWAFRPLRAEDLPTEQGMPIHVTWVGRTALDRAWLAEALLAPRARRLWFGYILSLLTLGGVIISLFGLGRFNSNFPLMYGLLTLGLIGISLAKRASRCPDCGLDLVTNPRGGKIAGSFGLSHRQCPRCGYRRVEYITETEAANAPGPVDFTVTFTMDKSGWRWRRRIPSRFALPKNYAYLFGVVALICFGWIGYIFWATGGSTWLVLVVPFLSILVSSRREIPSVTLTYIFRSDGIYFDEKPETALCAWSPYLRAFDFQGGLVVTEGKRPVFAIPPQAVDAGQRAALERYLAAKGVSVAASSP